MDFKEADPHDFSGVEQIITLLPKKQLQLLVDFKEGSFKKIDSQKEEEKLVLSLIPDEGKTPVEPLNITAQVVGNKPNLIFTVGIARLSELGDLYTENEDFFKKISLLTLITTRRMKNTARST